MCTSPFSLGRSATIIRPVVTDPRALMLAAVPSWCGSTWVVGAGWLLGLALVPAILMSRKLPQAKIAWLLAVTGFPWIGAFLYVTFGSRSYHRRVMRRRSAHTGTDRLGVQRVFHRFRRRRKNVTDIIGEIERAGAFPPVPGNDLILLTEGPATFAAGRLAMRAATRHIHLVTYIFKDDATGVETVKLLAAAAARGVEVRVLHDGAGTFATRSRCFDPIRQAGGKVVSFLPISPFVPGLRLNLRNHRKLLIVDGAVALTGGRNIGDEYATGVNWRDVHAQVRGPVIEMLQRVFAEDWYLATGEALDAERYFKPPPAAGDVPIQVVPSGPDQPDPLAPELMFGAITAARETIDIMTPYFVPTEPIEQAMRSAARRQRRVRLLVPEDIDHHVVRWATDSYLPRMIEAGVEVWRHPHMVHGKVVIVDNNWATLGSTNLDMRSLFLNFELNLAIPHVATATALTRHFEQELARSRRLTLDDFRAPWYTRLMRATANLASPLL